MHPYTIDVGTIRCGPRGDPIPLAPTGLPSFPDMSRAGRGEPRPHDLIGAWSDTADPNNRILSRPRQCAVCPVKASTEDRHPAPAGGLLRGRHPTPTRTGCASSTGGPQGLRQFPADACEPTRSRRPGAGLRRGRDVVLRGGEGADLGGQHRGSLLTTASRRHGSRG